MINNDILYSNFIKYDKLYHMCMKAFYNRNDINVIDIMIDMNSLTRDLYKYPNSVYDPRMIAASMINLCAHLKQYFYSRHNVYTKIYIVYATNRPKGALKFCPSYNAHYITKINANIHVTQSILDSCELLKSICPYLQDIYFIKDNYDNEASFIMAYFCNKRESGDYHIIYSKDAYTYQLVAQCSNTCLFRPRKSREGDTSYLVLKSNIYETYREEELRNKPIKIGNSISHELFGLMIALNGFKFRGIPNTISNGTDGYSLNNRNSLKIIQNAIIKKNILNGYIFPTNIDPVVLGVPEVLTDTFCNRFKALDLVYQYNINALILEEIESNVINLYDPMSVQAINNSEFKNFPLDLNNL